MQLNFKGKVSLLQINIIEPTVTPDFVLWELLHIMKQ